MHNPGLSINIGSPHGIRPGGCCQGPQAGHGTQGMMRMMQLMSQMSGGGAQQGGCCCQHHNPGFGQGNRGGIHINMGASIQGFLG